MVKIPFVHQKGDKKMNYSYITMKVQLSKEEKDCLKKHAKSKGMTLQGYLAQVLKNQLKKEEERA